MPARLYFCPAGQTTQRPHREYRLINVISALLACLFGVLHAGLASLVTSSDMRPSLILAAVTATTIGFGLEAGAIWAFIGGVTANLLTTDPLGTLPLGLLLVAALLAAAARLRLPTVALAALGGALGSLLLGGLAALWMWIGIDPATLPANGVLAILLPSALVNGALAVAFWLGLRAILGRMGREPALA